MTPVVNGRFLAQRPGGLQRTGRSMLAALRELGVPLDVVAPAPDPLVDRVLRAPGGRAGGQLWEQLLLPAAARGRPLLSLTNTSPLAAGSATVVVHDLATLVGPQWFRPSMRLYGYLVLAAARRASRVVTVSEAVRAELESRGVRSDRLTVVSPAVDPSFAPAHDSEVAAVRRRLGIEGPYVVLPGWADPRKDAVTAVTASMRVPAQHTLVLVGGGRAIFAPVRLPASDRVVPAGHVSDSDLRALLTGAAALLYPSRYEGYGLPPLEAWACGTPALVSDLAVLRESTGGRAVYVPVGDVAAWSDAIAVALSDGFAVPPPPSRTWRDAAGELAGLLG
jgi:glycosyltransferase involved in cell wall biosynthesis